MWNAVDYLHIRRHIPARTGSWCSSMYRSARPPSTCRTKLLVLRGGEVPYRVQPWEHELFGCLGKLNGRPLATDASPSFPMKRKGSSGNGQPCDSLASAASEAASFLEGAVASNERCRMNAFMHWLRFRAALTSNEAAAL